MERPTPLRDRLSFVLGVLGVLGLAAGLVACSSDAGSSSGGSSQGSDSGAPAASGTGAAASPRGVTSCGSFPDNQPKRCQAGQYCADERVSRCETGCLSDDNCASNQTCDKSSGGSVGACLNTAPATTTSCADLCKKAKACSPQLDTAQCEGGCIGLTEDCKACVVRQPCTASRDACKSVCN